MIEGRNVVLFIFVSPLLALDTEEGEAKHKGQQQHSDLHLAISQLGEAYRHGDGQAAAQQNDGIKGADWQVQRSAGGRKFGEVHAAINKISAEHAAEEHYFCPEEPPHAE